MIASFGGATIDKYGNRDFPGAGGMIGALSPPGKNYSYILGGGPVYHSFTPNENVEPIEPCVPTVDGPCPPGGIPPQPPILPYGPGGPTIGPGTTPPPYVPPLVPGGPDPLECESGNCSEPLIGPVGTIAALISKLLGTTRAGLDAGGPVYLFTPQPGSGAGGFDMKNLLILAAVLGLGFFAYKKWA